MPIIETQAKKSFLTKEFNRINRKYKQAMIDWGDTDDEEIGVKSDAMFVQLDIIASELKERRKTERKENPDPLWKAYYQRKK